MEDNQCRIFYYDSSCILLVNSRGKIRKLFTPFRVYWTHPAGKVKEKWLFVDEVHIDKTDRLLYLINGKLYPYFNFQIRISF